MPRKTRARGRVNTYTGILGCVAECYDCDWRQESKNALGSAARHADAYPDHTVSVEQTLGVTYNRKSDAEVLEQVRQCGATHPHDAHPRGAMVNGNLVQTECPGIAGPAEAPPEHAKPWF